MIHKRAVVLAVCVAIVLSVPLMVQAQPGPPPGVPPGPGGGSLAARVAALENALAILQDAFATHIANSAAHHAPYTDADAIAAVDAAGYVTGPHTVN